MADYNIPKMSSKLQKYLNEERYNHTLGVMYTSAALAMCYGADLEKAQVAGLLHDCAKCIPNDKKLKICKKHNIPVSTAENNTPYLLHAKVGVYIAEEKYNVHDPEILGAIRWHTTGRAEMTLMEEIVFLADYIEPMRCKAENLPKIRRLAFQDLDLAVYMTLRDTLDYLGAAGSAVDETTRSAYLYYKEKTGN